ncbi:hypothetical protein EVAR_33831_1 [Eumeta japonica]|uniref:Uncharacterized protein n=1 Tax=Eumeta variegata TaxID=151549 RepID=A0A4C1V9Q1_EUMVA|nr:hypothetical protein EVAR_33831_1 [Eumeta japonica]
MQSTCIAAVAPAAGVLAPMLIRSDAFILLRPRQSCVHDDSKDRPKSSGEVTLSANVFITANLRVVQLNNKTWLAQRKVSSDLGSALDSAALGQRELFALPVYGVFLRWHASHQTIDGHRCPWTLARLEELPVCCRSLA